MSLGAVVLASVVAAAASVHLAVSTGDARAQSAVDRGVFLYYAYNEDDSAASFAQAAAADPRLAMAYWGIALANGPDLNTPENAARFARASAAIEKAVGLAGGLPARERGFITILAQRYRGAFADSKRDDAAYRQAMLQFARQSQDENAELLAAEALIESGGLTWQRGALAGQDSRDALALVTNVLRVDPTNPMANHLCIHLYDLAPDRSPALPCAQRLDATTFPPEAEHLAHMPAHYWIETGDYAAALASSNRAYALLVQLEGRGSAHARHYAKHDISVGYSAAMMLGNYSVARLWAQRMGGAFDTSFDAVTALRFGHYAAAYAADDTGYGGASVRGLAAIELGRMREAHSIGARVSARNTTQGYFPQLFLARLAEADGKFPEAARWIETARANQGTDFAGEVIPLLPAGEVLAGLNLRRRDYDRAVAAYTSTLASYPNDPRALFGLATALAAQGQQAQAAAARSRFELEWKGADTNVNDASP
jgi:tetratricopeptide (TPR) repeat protein